MYSDQNVGTLHRLTSKLYGNILSFLGGTHACIGYRFVPVEWKATLFTLLRKFEFELAVPATEIESDSTVVHHPFLQGDKERENQLPVIIRPVKSGNL